MSRKSKGASQSGSSAQSKDKATQSGPNVKPQPYVSVMQTAPECEKDRKRIESKCKPDPEPEQDANGKPKPKPAKKGLKGIVSKAGEGLDSLARAGYTRNQSNAWMDSHCDFMWLKPIEPMNAAEIEKLKQGLEQLKNEKWGLVRHGISELSDLAIEKAGDAAKTKLRNLALRTAAKHIVGIFTTVLSLGTVGTAVEAGMIAWTVTDVLSTGAELAAMAGEEGAAIFAAVQQNLKIGEVVSQALHDLQTNPDKVLAEAMELAGSLNACLRARRCQLVSMSQTSALNAKKHGMGCCPGQTGHHLLPKEMFKRKIEVDTGQKYKNGKPIMKKVDDPENCTDYTNSVHNNAPVLCVEGTNQNTASHKKVHDSMDKLMERHRLEHKDTISNEQAIDAGVKSLKETFKSGCNPECLKAQLKSYYDKLCNGKMKPRSGKGKTVENTGDGTVEVDAA
ncbi:HNH/endonuclease VII fold toxin-2 domain-containing protein [Massilia sp. W12]|uniref:HNH/endonuclease VII fold toxin-2 domain-containing protein n=1 Tax=Massilia sp. W12 TaxID=3126507 RepID=UPI0030D62AE1